MQINIQRLQSRIDELSKIGRTPGGGVTRLALTDEDRLARELLLRWMQAAGLTVRVDDFGNIIGRREGANTNLLPILVGSHLDTVPRGGRFDGSLGVLAALEVVTTLNDLGLATQRPIEIINWTNEEGVRFQPATLCSGAVVGSFSKDYVYNRCDSAGKTFEDELTRIGYRGSASARPGPAHCYLELHIEQGPVLEAHNIPIGVVEGIVGITWCNIELAGQANHAGTTPMQHRRDALVAAAQLIQSINHLTRTTDNHAVGTVGSLYVEPNAVNVIPGKVVFTVDFRHHNGTILDHLVTKLHTTVHQISTQTNIEIRVNCYWRSEPTPFDASIISLLERTAQALGYPHLRLWSGATHDARHMATVCPTGMLFVRSKAGLSHCEQEFSSLEDIAIASNTLLHALLTLANT